MLQQNYPEARIELINSGTSGDTCADGLALMGLVGPHEPDLVTINFGINDCVMCLGLDEFELNLVQMGAASGRGRMRRSCCSLHSLWKHLPTTKWFWITIRLCREQHRRWMSGSWTFMKHG